MSVFVTVNAQKERSDCSDPQDPMVISLVKQAAFSEAKQDVVGAIKLNKKILEIEPKNECALNTIAGLYGVMEDFEQEIIYAKLAIEANSKFANAYINLGNAQGTRGNLKEAEEAFSKAHELAPKSPLGVYSLGVLAEQQRKFSEATGFYQKSIEIDPKFENGYFNLAAMYANLKRFARSKSHFEKIACSKS